MPNVEIYTQPGCPFCVRAILLLQKKEIEFKEINAPRGSAERDEAIKRSGGQTTVPQIFINDQSIGGCSELTSLDKSGELDRLLT